MFHPSGELRTTRRAVNRARLQSSEIPRFGDEVVYPWGDGGGQSILMRSEPPSTLSSAPPSVSGSAVVSKPGETCDNDVSLPEDALVALAKKDLDQGVANEVTDVKDKLVVSLQEKLNHVAPLSSSKACIFRVPSALRGVNEEAYTPQVISIGPYHHGTKKLEPMEEHKLRYLSDFFGRKPIRNLEYFVKSLRELEEAARQCYGQRQTIEEDSNKFVEMMLLDGCFVIELFLKFWEQKDEVVTTDPIFHNASVISGIRVDLLLLENQLPFFILECLFILVRDAEKGFLVDSFYELALKFFDFKYLLNIAEGFTQISNTSEIKHFLDLLSVRSVPEDARVPHKSKEDCKFIPSATELREAGVKFKKLTRKCILDLDFTKGTLQIPELIVQDTTETLFRNLIAFEQCSKGCSEQYITHYLALMDFIINSPSDVAILRHAGIIDNWLGDNEQVSLLFNKITVGVTMVPHCFYFNKLAEDVNIYYESRWNSFKAMLDREYFYSPWSTASSIAVIIVVVCTIIQTVCTVIQSVSHG